MKKISIALLLVMTFLVSGCAGLPSEKVAAEYFSNRVLVIAPTGAAKVEGLSSTIGGGFGALGVLVEHAVTESSRTKSASRVGDLLPVDVALSIAAKRLAEKSSQLGPIKSYRILSRTMPTDDFGSWFFPDTRVDSSEYLAAGAEVMIDLGFHSIVINNYMAGRYAEAHLGIRVVDLRSGKVLTRARTFGVGAFGGEKIEAEPSDANFDQAVVSSFTKLIQRLADETLAKIAAR